MPSNVLVTGLSNSQFNGLYLYDGPVNGKPSYQLNAVVRIHWDVPLWEPEIPGYWTAEVDGGVTTSASNVSYPWLATNWIGDDSGIVLTETSDNTIFGLNPTVAALITSRHGSVARYLRLRNQGQI